MQQIIHIQPLAAAKPVMGAPCNGCGVCCLSEPCPLGMILSGRRVGACDALQWEPQQAIYRCGAITNTKMVVQDALPHVLRFLSPVLTPLIQRWSRRWVAAGQGCDCSLEIDPLA